MRGIEQMFSDRNMHKKFLLSLDSHHDLLVIDAHVHPDFSGSKLNEVLKKLTHTTSAFWVENQGALAEISLIREIGWGTVLSNRNDYKNPHSKGASLYLDVVAGPDHVQSFPLYREQTLSLGKDACDLMVQDPSHEPCWGEIRVDSQGALLTEDRKVSELSLNKEFRRGATSFTLRSQETCSHRNMTEEHFSPIALDLPQRRNLFQLGTMMVLPLIIGTVIALLTGMWFFLAMSAASSIVMGITLRSSRGQSKKYQEILDGGKNQDEERARSIHGLECAGFLTNPQSEVLYWGRGQRPLALRSQQLRYEKLPVLTDIPLYSRFYVDEPQVIRLAVSLPTLRNMILQILSKIRGRRVVIDPPLLDALPTEFDLLRVLPYVEILDSAKELDASSSDQWLIIGANTQMPVSRWKGSVLVIEDVGNATVSVAQTDSLPTTVVRENQSQTTENLHISFQNFREASTVADNYSEDICCSANGISASVFQNLLAHKISPASCAPASFFQHASTISKSSLTSENPAFDSRALVQNWESSAYYPSLNFLVGISEGEEIELDLSLHGPHFLLAGTTGSGKSQLLRAMLLSLTYRYSPQRLALLLIDFKGAAGLGLFREAPHTKALLTDLEENEFERSLKFLRADLEQRERLFQELSVSSYPDYLLQQQSMGKEPDFPELLLVVDEFKMLIDKFPRCMNKLIRIATIGRSLGVHLLLSTQRPQGTISSDISSNIGTTLCLRVASTQESFSILGVDQAATLPMGSPGLGFIKYSDGGIVPFRGLYIDAPRYSVDHAPVHVSILGTNREEHFAVGRELDEDARLLTYLRSMPAPHQSQPYTPIPERDAAPPANFCIAGGLRLGILEIPELGLQREVELTSDSGPVSLVAETFERREYFKTILMQAASLGAEIHITCGELSSFDEITSFIQDHRLRVSSLIGPFDADFQTLVWSQSSQRVEAHRPLIYLLEGIDIWVEENIKNIGAVNQLHSLIMNSSTSHSVIFAGSHLSLRGRLGQLFHTQLMSATAVSQDPIRSLTKDFLRPARGNFAVEGKLLQSNCARQTVKSAELFPVAFSNISDILPDGLTASQPAATSLTPYPVYRQLPLSLTIAQLKALPLAPLSPSRVQNSLVLTIGITRQEQIQSIGVPTGQCTVILGQRLSGKSTFLQALQKLNPQYSYLLISGKQAPTDADLAKLNQQLERYKNCVVLVDDTQYLSTDTQQRLMRKLKNFSHLFFTLTPSSRNASLPLYSASIGAIRGLIFQPHTLRDLEFFGNAYLPSDLKTQGEVPAGRAVYISNGDCIALQVPHG